MTAACRASRAPDRMSFEKLARLQYILPSDRSTSRPIAGSTNRRRPRLDAQASSAYVRISCKTSVLSPPRVAVATACRRSGTVVGARPSRPPRRERRWRSRKTGHDDPLISFLSARHAATACRGSCRNCLPRPWPTSRSAVHAYRTLTASRIQTGDEVPWIERRGLGHRTHRIHEHLHALRFWPWL